MRTWIRKLTNLGLVDEIEEKLVAGNSHQDIFNYVREQRPKWSDDQINNLIDACRPERESNATKSL